MIKSVIRTLAFAVNWTVLVARQPTMILSMIVGPFLVLLLFGIGTVFEERPPATILVTQGSATEGPFSVSTQDLSAYLTIVGETDDLNYALGELRAQRTRLVVLLPSMPQQTVRAGERATVKIFTNEINPVRLTFIQIDIRGQMAVVNSRVGERALDLAKETFARLQSQLTQAETQMRSAGVSTEDLTRARATIDEIQSIPSHVLVSPFDAEIENIAPLKPTMVSYFTPAAIALVIQHLAVTLAALSMVRARLLGTVELWQVAPVRLGEIVAGNYLSYGVLTLAVSWILVVAVSWALFVPVLGSVKLFLLAIILLLLASLGIGFVISLLSSSEQVAAQISMILLLASIFLGGFAVSLDQIIPQVRVVSYLLPATYGAQILQSVMVRGEDGSYLFYVALGVIALLGLIATVRLFHRELRPM